MKKQSSTAPRRNTQDNAQDFVAWSAVAMWGAAALFLLVTFRPF